MNKILLITPLFKIVGRDDLFRDTEAIYDLVKYWGSDAEVYVLNTYIHGFSEIKGVLKKERLRYYRVGYDYNAENIKTTLVERQNIIPGQIDTSIFDARRCYHIISKKLTNLNFFPTKVVVHLPSTSQSIVKKLRYNCEKIAILHMTDVKYYKKHSKKFINFLNNYYSRVYCRSKAIHDVFKDAGLKNLKSDIIYSGVSQGNGYKLKKNIEFKNKINILYVGKLIRRKNLDILIQTMSKFKDLNWNINVVGVGPMYDEYKKTVDILNLSKKVKFIGALPKIEVIKKMRDADIFCMPSINETLGLVYLEAMSQGCITIGTKNEGIDGIIINNKNGFLVEPTIEDLFKLFDKIFKLSYDELEKISYNAIQTSLEFDENNMSMKYLSIIKGE